MGGSNPVKAVTSLVSPVTAIATTGLKFAYDAVKAPIEAAKAAKKAKEEAQREAERQQAEQAQQQADLKAQQEKAKKDANDEQIKNVMRANARITAGRGKSSRSTILTSPLGIPGAGDGAKKTLLGL